MKIVFFVLTLFLVQLAQSQTPSVSSGSIVRYEQFASNYITPRNVDVWLPKNYNPKNKYQVLYMHDGQMLFDSTHTWNHAEWGVDETLTKLIAEKEIKPCIVVGIWNAGLERHADYFPQKPFESLSASQQDSLYNANRANGNSVFNQIKVHSDAYLKFVVEELKPFIDAKYSTWTDREHCVVAGSSMGGLISLYAICEYPEVFGGAACMSTHWPGVFGTENNPIPDAFFSYMKKHLPNAASHKIYFDYGNQTLDAMYPPLQQKADAIMIAKGYTKASWQTLFFPGENHSEGAWSKRLHLPILFLMKK